MATIQYSDSISIAHYGTEIAGTVIVTVDETHQFAYRYTPYNPCQSYERLALLAMNQC